MGKYWFVWKILMLTLIVIDALVSVYYAISMEYDHATYALVVLLVMLVGYLINTVYERTDLILEALDGDEEESEVPAEE